MWEAARNKANIYAIIFATGVGEDAGLQRTPIARIQALASSCAASRFLPSFL